MNHESNTLSQSHLTFSWHLLGPSRDTELVPPGEIKILNPQAPSWVLRWVHNSA